MHNKYYRYDFPHIYKSRRHLATPTLVTIYSALGKSGEKDNIFSLSFRFVFHICHFDLRWNLHPFVFIHFALLSAHPLMGPSIIFNRFGRSIFSYFVGCIVSPSVGLSFGSWLDNNLLFGAFLIFVNSLLHHCLRQMIKMAITSLSLADYQKG